jgi:hypothetical protein
MDQKADENPYQSPGFANTAASKPPKEALPGEKRIRGAIFMAIGESIVLSILASLFLDRGETACIWVICMIVWWAAIILILLRLKFGKSHFITHVDLFIIRSLGLPLFFLAVIFAFIWSQYR